VWESGRPEFVDDVVEDENFPRATAAAEAGLHAAICFALITHGRRFGVIEFLSTATVQPDKRLLEALAAIGTQAAQALESARLFEFERSLRLQAEQGARAAQALAYVADGVVLLDAEGRIGYWNPAASALTGLPEEAALSEKAAAVIPGWAQFEAALSVGAPRTIAVTWRGEERWLLVVGVAFAEGSVFTIRDVTLERSLEQARSDLVVTASHELRTPVSAVYGAARTLLRDDVEFSERDRLALLAMIEREGERLARIVDQILVAGQLEAGVLHLAAEPCDLAAVAAGVIETMTREPRRVRLRASKSLPPIRCDQDRFRQVLGNLLENAIKYSPDGGAIEVRLRLRPDSTVVLEVADHGIGIPASQHERIFDKFHRLDPALSGGVGGTGLGLYITRELVTRMGGRIAVRSEPGKGATFSVELPA
jgi:PAS domain S-box-containing protein